MSGFTSPTLARVVGGRLCSGCGLCASLSGGAVEMHLAAPGYARPRETAPVSPEIDRLIEATCPGSIVAPWGQAPHTDPRWGPYRAIYTGHATSADMRHAGSSGGVLSALLAHILETGQADRIVHTAMDEAAPTLNRIQRSFGRDAVLAAAGSRYAPASPLAGIVDELDRGGRFVFLGKPCDVSALRMLAKQDARVDAAIPLMLSFFCAGTPSQNGTDRILTRLGADKAKLKTFRYRGDGWPGFATAIEQDGRTTRMSYADSWGNILSKEVQFRCKICPDAVGGVADLACADAWYGDESGYPSFDEAEGRSLIMVRTPAGEALLAAALDAGAVAAEPLPVGDIVKMQPHQANRKQMVASRLAAAAALFQPRPSVAGLMVGAAARRASVKAQAKDFLGAARRIVRHRLNTSARAAETSN